MESGWIQPLLDWIAANPGWAGFAVFVLAFLESLVIIGFLLPGIFILFAIGAMIGLGMTGMLPIWVGGSLGAVAGDLVSYWVGHRYQQRLRTLWPFSRYPGMLLRGDEFFARHGAKSVIIGRFIGPLRPVVPATAGMLGMPLSQFAWVSVPACILWTPAYLVPGMLFGASLEVASDYAGRLALVLALAVGVVWLALWAVRMLYEISAVYSARWLRRAIRWSRRHPVLGRLAGPILDPSQPEVLSVSMLGLLLVVALWGFVLLMFLAPFGPEPGVRDLAVMNWAQTLRNDITDPFMVVVSQLSRWWVLLPTLVATLLWLLGAERLDAAIHWLVAMAGAMVLQALMAMSLRATPALQAAGSEHVYVPSAHLTLVTVLLGFFSVMVAKELRRKHRRWPYLAATLLVTLLLFARIYLGLDWFSGALAGVILGLAWTAIVGMAYRARAKRHFAGGVACAIFFGTLVMTIAWQADVHLDRDLEAVRVPLPEATLAESEWWDGAWAELPQRRTYSRSVASRRFNFQMVGDIETLREALEAEGWAPAEADDWRWFLRALNPNADEATLPLTGKNYLGHRETLVLRLPGSADEQMVLRLWDSGTRLVPGGDTVWLGQFHRERLVKRVWLFSYWNAAEPAQADVSDLEELLGPAWQFQQALPYFFLLRPAP
ncbi:hypothetical protein F3N42_09805 [Marinihelvus fidelis]|uniref:Uncharacterized protein n=1 Tax=Marinihelvus fidelis TaxID=2613842 RepID=A0A5N0T9I9_9GAMM|nr:VTT domain-containing protein [Marinihelvus fidelis]KAA9131600.1 hypothetical protein F3N42_09805 [Marinihelvus fidelis]